MLELTADSKESKNIHFGDFGDSIEVSYNIDRNIHYITP